VLRGRVFNHFEHFGLVTLGEADLAKLFCVGYFFFLDAVVAHPLECLHKVHVLRLCVFHLRLRL